MKNKVSNRKSLPGTESSFRALGHEDSFKGLHMGKISILIKTLIV